MLRRIHRPAAAVVAATAASSLLAPAASCRFTTLLAAPVTPTRALSFKVFVDESNPDNTLRHAREVKDREEHLGRAFSTKYLHALINVALAHFQRKDYDMARKCALYAHDVIIEKKGSRHVLVYFSSITAARCSRALAQKLQGALDDRKAVGNAAALDEDVNSSRLAVKGTGQTFGSVEAYVSFLFAEARRFDRIAERLINMPDKFFMKSDAQHRADAAREDAGSDRDFEHTDGFGGANANANATSARKKDTKSSAGSSDKRTRSFEKENRRMRTREEQAVFDQYGAQYVTYAPTEDKGRVRADPKAKHRQKGWHTSNLRVPR